MDILPLCNMWGVMPAVRSLCYFLVVCSGHIINDARPNVLFIVSDDMRPQLTPYYGTDFPSPVHPKMQTPNLERLAAQSVVFRRAHVQQAVCGPSRTSFLTGRRPDTTHVYDNVHYFRRSAGNFTTIPEYFKEHGYISVGMGKIFHPGRASGEDDPESWTEPYWHPPNEKFWLMNRSHSYFPVEPADRRQTPLPDDQIAEHAVQTLHRLARTRTKINQPFFAAVGFLKPHLPFVFPKEFLNSYLVSGIQLPRYGYAPNGMPKVAWEDYSELRSYHDMKRFSGNINSSLPKDDILALRRAYYSSISFTDSLIGVLLDTLEKLKLEQNTVVVFLGDHGWQLGEHGEWCKHNNFELSTHAPLIMRIPNITDGGMVSENLVEFVDIFPTLAEAAGLPPIPHCPVNSGRVRLCHEGSSLMPLLRKQKTAWKSRVFSQFPREVDGTPVMGYSMRTRRYRYTEWVRFVGRPHYKPIWQNNFGVELYDHYTDPYENTNHANDLDYVAVRKNLSQKLHLGWRRSLPHI